MSPVPARERLADAALDLFAQRGYEQTTVDDIAERAGVGRSSFFRYYRSKEDAIFPDHARLQQDVAARLAASSHSTALAAVTDAVRLVMHHYVREGDRARRRYELTSAIPVLRDREIASVAVYQRMFREFIDSWMGDGVESALRAELMAASVVAAHNHVLRRYLRGECADPIRDVEAALGQVLALFTTSRSASSSGTTVLAFETPASLEYVLETLKGALAGAPVAD